MVVDHEINAFLWISNIDTSVIVTLIKLIFKHYVTGLEDTDRTVPPPV